MSENKKLHCIKSFPWRVSDNGLLHLNYGPIDSVRETFEGGLKIDRTLWETIDLPVIIADCLNEYILACTETVISQSRLVTRMNVQTLARERVSAESHRYQS